MYPTDQVVRFILPAGRDKILARPALSSQAVYGGFSLLTISPFTSNARLHIGSVTSFLSRKPETRCKDYLLQGSPMERRELSSHQLNPIILVCFSIAIHAGAVHVSL